MYDTNGNIQRHISFIVHVDLWLFRYISITYYIEPSNEYVGARPKTR